MARSRLTRLFKVCRICGEGYDAFKSRESRGRYCSASCLTEARRRQRDGLAVAEEPVIGPAMLPPTILLGNRSAIFTLGPELNDEGPGLTT